MVVAVVEVGGSERATTGVFFTLGRGVGFTFSLLIPGVSDGGGPVEATGEVAFAGVSSIARACAGVEPPDIVGTPTCVVAVLVASDVEHAFDMFVDMSAAGLFDAVDVLRSARGPAAAGGMPGGADVALGAVHVTDASDALDALDAADAADASDAVV